MSLKRISGINPNDPTFSASQIVGQSLIAKKPVTVFDEPYDDASPVGTYQAGQTVGVVTSWLDADPNGDRSVLFWQFMDASGAYYYAPHYIGEFDVQSLVDSGAQTTGMQTQAAIDASKSTIQVEFEKYVPWIIGGILLIGLVGVFLKAPKKSAD